MLAALAALLLQAPDACHAVTPAVRPAAGCPAWRSLQRNAEGELLADPASLRRDGTGFEIAIRFVYPEAGPGMVRSLVAAFRFDCAARTVAMGGGHAFDAAGARLDEEEPAEGLTPPAPVADDAREAAVLAAYCPG